MNFRAVLAILLCKALRLISRLLHRGGTAMPGRYALKLCPQLLSILAENVKVIAVTGTNGKTTTARMIEQAFIDEKKSYFSNRSGANLISGITTEFVMNSSLSGKCLKDYAVIECDEAAAVRVFRELKPEVIVVTNLFRDQLDRFGAVTHTLEVIEEAVKNVPEAVLCLNADCSLTSSMALNLPNRVIYFGVGRGAGENHGKAELSDASRCIRCGAEYEYDYVVYGHLGGFRCPECGYSRHEADFEVADIVEQNACGSTVVMNMQGEKRIVNINLPAIYNIYNAAAAAAAVCEIGLGRDAAVNALAGFSCGFGRMEHFDIGGGTRMMLVKNPAGCNQIVEFLRNVKENFVLVLCLNDHGSDGRDISWIWDADFEGLCTLGGRLRRVVVSGDRAAELRLRIKYAGIDDSFIETQTDYGKLVEWIKSQEDAVFIVPNYSSMLEVRQAIVKHCGGKEFWE
ncbi:MAG: MurT ligase domain-containing protein [Candidatus Limivicinus sp.]|jgi:UDP-N-acetylmuramyl tripeptide synthase